MFCVVKDNVDHVDQLEQEPSNIDLKFLSKKKPKFFWDFMKKKPDISWEPYKYGTYLLQVKATPHSEHNVLPFGVPSSLYSKQCSATEFIKFLQPIQTKCKVQVNDLRSSCTGNSQLNINTFLKNTAFVSNPNSMNITKSVVPLIMGLCSSFRNGSRLCHLIPSFDEPKWDESTSTCANILESLELTFIHAGTEGLLKVIAKGQLGDYNLSYSKDITQEFSTNFFWRTTVIDESIGNEEILNMTLVIEKERQLENERDVHPLDWPRSGNPGYILGKPVVMGDVILREVEKEKEGREQTDPTGKEEANKEDRDYEEGSSENVPSADKGGTAKPPPERLGISVSRDPKGWMTIHSPGKCNGVEIDPRLNVLFGVAHQSECLVNISNYLTCKDLQIDIVKTILGISSLETDFGERHVAAFGNPDLDDLNDWVRVYITGLPTNLGASVSVNHGCDRIVSTMKIKIAYAYVGPVNFPQAKIIGVLYEFGDSFNIPKKVHCLNDEIDCILYQHHVRVATTVVFIDATKAPTPKIGQWPVVSIKLPQDFFYPFATSSSARLSKAQHFVFVPLFYFLVFYI